MGLYTPVVYGRTCALRSSYTAAVRPLPSPSMHVRTRLPRGYGDYDVLASAARSTS